MYMCYFACELACDLMYRFNSIADCKYTVFLSFRGYPNTLWYNMVVVNGQKNAVSKTILDVRYYSKEN